MQTLLSALGHPSYPWLGSSCWFDTALEGVWNGTHRDFASFASRFNSIPKDSDIYQLFQHIDRRRALYLQDGENHTPEGLSTLRNTFREVLNKPQYVPAGQMGNVVVCFKVLLICIVLVLTTLSNVDRGGFRPC